MSKQTLIVIICIVLHTIVPEYLMAQHPVANNKALLDKKCRKWLKNYEKCTAYDFDLDSTRKYVPEIVDKKKLSNATKNNYSAYLFYSPNKRYAVDIMSGICTVKKVKGKEVEELCDDGGNIYLWDTKTNIRYKIGYGALYTRYGIAHWLSDDVFVVGYTTYDEEGTEKNQVYLEAFDLTNKKCYFYHNIICR